MTPSSITPATAKTKETRRRRFAKIHILWKDLRPDLSFDSDRREELLAFASGALNLGDLASLGDLTTGQLGKLLDALTREASSPRLPGQSVAGQVSNLQSQISNSPSLVRGGIERPSDVIHLASEHQVWAINTLFNHLHWSSEARSNFLQQRFKRKAPMFLTPRQADRLIPILLTIAASSQIKKEAADRGQPLDRVSREMARARFPQLKKELGLGQVIR